jgi:hypothetical protein
MNEERFRELAFRAGFVGDSLYPVFGTCQETALRNFAVLIVEECVDHIKRVGVLEHIETETTMVADSVKERFGLKS